MRGYTRICETLVEDLQGFTRLWDRICKELLDLGRGFAQVFVRL